MLSWLGLDNDGGVMDVFFGSNAVELAKAAAADDVAEYYKTESTNSTNTFDTEAWQEDADGNFFNETDRDIIYAISTHSIVS